MILRIYKHVANSCILNANVHVSKEVKIYTYLKEINLHEK